MKSFNKNYFDGKDLEDLKKTITPTGGWNKETILKQLDMLDVPTTSRSVYEIGAGCGRLLKVLHEKGYRIEGCDASECMVKEAKIYLGMNRVSLCSGEGIIPTKERFDFVFSWITFQHIPNINTIKSYIKEAKRILNKGGNFHFQLLSKGQKSDGVLWNVHDLKELKRCWIDAGFKEVYVREGPSWTVVKLKNE